MGIRNLKRWIEWIQYPLYPMPPIEWERLRGYRIGVDALSFLYRAKTEGRDMLEMLDALVRAIRAWGIEPVFVFDGKSPREKDGTRSSRRKQKQHLDETVQQALRVSSEDRNTAKQLFYALGILSLNAEEEADSLLAYLSRRGDLAAVVSFDMDFLPRGVQKLILPNTLTDLTQWSVICLSDLLQRAELTYTQFTEMCVLMGCDYAPYIPTLSYSHVYMKIREGRRLLDILESEGVRTGLAWVRAVSILCGERDSWDSLLSVRQRQKWATGAPFAEPHAEILCSLRLPRAGLPRC